MKRVMFFIVFMLIAVVGQSSEEKLLQLEQRVTSLEDYAQTIQPSLTDFSNQLNESVRSYTQGLSESLEEYGQQMQRNVNRQLKAAQGGAIALDLSDKAYQKIETNSGTFLIAVEKVDYVVNGARLHLQVGNPYAADFNGVKLMITWGPKWEKEKQTFEQWRQELLQAEYTYDGKLEKGSWNFIQLDFPSIDVKKFGYVECEMTVASVELQSVK